MESETPKDAYPKQEGAWCPSCERFIGPYRTCPYCGARIRERISTRFLKIFAIGFGIVGVVLLWIMSANTMVPQIRAEEIDNTTNFAYVLMKGVCTRIPTYDEKGKSLSFPLDDGTGQIWIKAYGAQAEEIYSAGKLPKPGDSVFVEGTVRMKGGYTYMIVNLPEKLTTKAPQFAELDISEISDSLWGFIVKTAGIINSVRKYESSMLLQLCSPLADACVDINVYFSSFPGLNPDEYERGDTLALVGIVSTYKDKLQLIPRGESEWWHKKGEIPKRIWTSGDKPPGNVQAIRLKDLKKELSGKFVVVEGNVKSVKQIKGGVLVSIDDGTEVMSFPIWDRVLESVPHRDELQAGAKIKFTGKVGEYKGAMQVVPTYGPAVEITAGKLVKPQQPKTTEAKEAKISELTRDMLGQQVRIVGQIKRTKEIKGGILVTVDDGTGEMTFPIWNKVLNHVASKNDIKQGNSIDFIGKVEEYRGSLQVVPFWGENITIKKGEAQQPEGQKRERVQTKKTETAKPSEPVKIQLVELSDDLLGEIVTVEGEITNVKDVKGGILVTIRQGDEYMTTPLWQRVLDKVTNRDKIVKGARITITGKVGEFKGSLQVVPEKGENVQVE